MRGMGQVVSLCDGWCNSADVLIEPCSLLQRLGGGPSQNSHEDSWSVFTASAGLHQGCPHQCPGFLVVGWFYGPTLNSWATKTPCFFFIRVTDEHGPFSSALGQLICNCNMNSRLSSYSLNYIMLILTHYSKLILSSSI